MLEKIKIIDKSKRPVISDFQHDKTVSTDLQKSTDALLSLQRKSGYWWFTLEANESIDAEYIFLMHIMDEFSPEIARAIAKRILSEQRDDGTWSLYYGGPSDISTTVECYMALKLAGYSIDNPALKKARNYILTNGGAENSRVFTLIHMAILGLAPWSVCPEMPAEFMLLPTWQRFNIYEFSSWARATIVPLLVIGTTKFVKKWPNHTTINEIFKNPPNKRRYKKPPINNWFSFEGVMVLANVLLKVYSKLTPKSLRKKAIHKCLSWIKEHINKTEDIYPALAYGAMAFKAMGYSNDSPEIRKPMNALRMFQQGFSSSLPAMPDELPDGLNSRLSDLRDTGILYCDPDHSASIHQQCCISPLWDTPWSLLALLEAGVSPSHPSLIKAGKWLISKQITDVLGDWAIKNPNALPGGWSFEFENEYFPDVDDTVAICTVLNRIKLPLEEKVDSIDLAVKWILSMQSKNGGFGAFDKDNLHEWVNNIPFADHKACLDDPSPDITARVLELLCELNLNKITEAKSAVKYLLDTQEKFGGWFARWGVNYIYGTWCAVTALRKYGWALEHPRLEKASKWLLSIQNEDGGFGELPSSYDVHKFVGSSSCPSQTAWALMALTALGLENSKSAKLAVDYLNKTRGLDGLWSEPNYTGTGFPCHFYIRYHGYARYFPLLALARWNKAVNSY